MHSALKKDGKALYEYAREGLTVAREPRQVTIHELELLDLQLQGAPVLLPPGRPKADGSPSGGSDPQGGGAWGPFLRLRVRCSKGTYIRTLGEDIAAALGCGGHLIQLRRVQTGPFDASQCVTVEALEALDEAGRLDHLLPVQALLPTHTPVTLGSEDAGRFLSGLRRRGHWPNLAHVAVYGPATGGAAPVLLGSGHTHAGELIPGRLLSPIEIQHTLETSPEPTS